MTMSCVQRTVCLVHIFHHYVPLLLLLLHTINRVSCSHQKLKLFRMKHTFTSEGQRRQQRQHCGIHISVLCGLRFMRSLRTPSSRSACTRLCVQCGNKLTVHDNTFRPSVFAVALRIAQSRIVLLCPQTNNHAYTQAHSIYTYTHIILCIHSRHKFRGHIYIYNVEHVCGARGVLLLLYFSEKSRTRKRGVRLARSR